MSQQSKTGQVAEAARNVAETARDQAAEMAADVKERVRDEARSRAEDLRNSAAQETRKAAHAAEAAASEFDPNSLQAQAVGHVADKLEEIAQQVRSTDIDRMARTVSDFARRNPLLFVGGAAALGLVATRFLRAGNTGRDGMTPGSSHGGASDPWGSDTSYRDYSAGPRGRGSA